MNNHWTERLFVEKPALYRNVLENAVKRASCEAVGLCSIFSEFSVPKKGLVLDLCCGIGRHSVILAEKGFKVVGVDISPEYVARAIEMATSRDVNEHVEFRVGDMRKIKTVLKDFKGKFNVVINLSTSFGLYDEETDRRVLHQLSKVTASNGILVIEITNRDWLIRHFLSRRTVNVGDDLVKVIEEKLNLENSRIESVWYHYKKEGKDLKFLDTIEVNHRVYSLHELKRLVEESGWVYQTCYGSFALDRFTMDSNRIILVAKKM